MLRGKPLTALLMPSCPCALKPFFVFACILPFILLPLLSLSSSISGDEPVHLAHAEKVYQYFETQGADQAALNTPETYLKYYGQFADDLSYRIQRLLNSDDPYLIRHLMNALFGALTILFSALIAYYLAGHLAGILVVLFLLLSPVFLGHTFNNIKDIPFALGYVMTLFFLLRFLQLLPKIRLLPIAGMIIGTAFSLSVRAGGLLLFPIIITFTVIQGWMLLPHDRTERNKFGLRLAASLILIVCLGWLTGILDWPYARLSPVTNTLKALAMMTRYNVSIRQVFDGQLIWSETIPWFYAPKYLLITTPETILSGLLLFFLSFFLLSPFAFRLPAIKKHIPLIAILFAAIFPLLWIIIKHSNLYGGIRHLLFIYPLIVVFAALGWTRIFQRLARVQAKMAVAGLLAAGCLVPLIHIVRNHPVEYVYYNSVSGGIKNAWGKYETDYYYHSLGSAVEWLEKEILSNEPDGHITVASSFPLEPYFLTSDHNPRLVYIPYYQRGEKEWDYGIFPVAYLSPSQLKNGCWPPAGTIHSVRVNGYPVCAIVRRQDKNDFYGYQAFMEERYADAVDRLSGITGGGGCNETALLYLGWSFRKLGNYVRSQESAARLLSIHPESEQAFELSIWNYLDTGETDKARALSEELFRLNPKYPPAGRFLKNVKTDSE